MNLDEANHIIKHKDMYSKVSIQKAQQRIDKTKQDERN